MSDTPRTDVAGKIAAAKSIVHELCQRQRSWTMSVPARPDYDPDLVIMDALEAAERELSTLRAKLEAGRNREQMYFRQRDEETARADAAEAKLAAAEKDAERKDAALRVARAAAIHGTTDGGKAVARMIDAAIEKECGNG